MEMTSEDAMALVRAMSLVSIATVIAWEVVKIVAVSFVRGIAAIFERSKRIQQARERALESEQGNVL